MIRKEYWFVVASGIIAGFVVFSGQVFTNLGLSLFQISTIPYIFAPFILLFILLKKREFAPRKGVFPLLVLYGVVSALTVVTQFLPLILGVPVAIVVLLLYSQPLWTILFSKIFLKEPLTRMQLLACVSVLLGIFVLVNPGQIRASWLGILVSLLGGLSLSGWMVVGSALSKRQNYPLNSVFFGHTIMLVILAIGFPILIPLIHNPDITRFSLDFPLNTWLALLAFGVGTQILLPYFYLLGTKVISTASAGIIMLMEPIVGSLLAVAFLNQPFTLGIVLGGALILLGNYLVIRYGENQTTSA